MDRGFSYENLRTIADSAHANTEEELSSRRRPPQKPTSLLRRVFIKSEVEEINAGELANEAILGLGLKQKELFLLKTAFDELDVDHSGKISRNEFLQAIGETDEPSRLNRTFLDKVFCMSDLYRDGLMDFDEFIVLSATFLMFAHRDMVRFVFGCYNKRGHGMFGEIDFTELSHHNNVVLAKPGKRDWMDILKYDKTFKGYLSESEFIVMAYDYPQIIYFASRLQAKMQDYCLGYAWYIKILRRQERARILEEHKKTHDGALSAPPEKDCFMASKWMQNYFSFLTGYDDYDVRTEDTTHLLNIGMIMYLKLYSSDERNRIYFSPTSQSSVSSVKVKKPRTAPSSMDSRKITPVHTPQGSTK